MRSVLTLAIAGLAIAAVPGSAQEMPANQIAARADRMRQAWAQGDGKPEPFQLRLYQRLLRFNLPAGFLITYQAQSPNQVLIEYAPDGEGVADWTRLLTIRALKDVGAASYTSGAIADRMFNPRQTCPSGPLYRNLGERAFAPGVTVTTIALGCASLPKGAYPEALSGAGEQDFVWLFRDADNYYALKYSLRGPAWPIDEPPIALADAEGQLARFGTVLLCAATDTDPACKDILAMETTRKSAQ